MDLLALAWLYADCVAITQGKPKLPSRRYAQGFLWSLSTVRTGRMLERGQFTGEARVDSVLHYIHTKPYFRYEEAETLIDDLLYKPKGILKII